MNDTKTRKTFGELADKIGSDPERAARADEHGRAIKDAIALGEIRGERQLPQSHVADQLGQTQANVSRIERQNDLYLSTLEQYVTSLGGRLRVLAEFPDETIELAPPARARAGEPAPELVAFNGERVFRTDPSRPGYVDVLDRDLNVADPRSPGAIAWAGSPILEMEADPEGEGVLVRSARSRGRIAKNIKGSWVLAESEWLDQPGSG